MMSKHDKDLEQDQEQDHDQDVAELDAPEQQDLHDSTYEYDDDGNLVAVMTVSGETVRVSAE